MRALPPPNFYFFFFNDTATTEIYTLSLHDALPISSFVLCQRPEPPRVGGCESRKRPLRKCAGPRPECPPAGSSREDSPFQPGIECIEAIVFADHRPVIGQFVLKGIGGLSLLGNVLARADREPGRRI